MRRWASRRVPSTRCDRCGAELDMYTGPDEGAKAGDISICIGCGTVRQFTEHFALEPVDVDALPKATRREVAKFLKALRRVHARRPN